MNLKFLRYQRMGALVLLLTIVSLVFTNCSSDDDFPVKPAPVVEEFEEIEDLEPVVDEEPTITEPETGEVVEPEVTGSIIADVLEASVAGDIAEDTKATLAEVEVFAATLPAEVTEVAANLDEAAVNAILDAEQELPAALVDLEASMEALPEEIANLLPAINFTSDFGEMAVKTSQGTKNIIEGIDSNIVSQTFGSCAEANQDAFNAVIEKLTSQRDANLAVVDANYTRRLAEADTRYSERVALQAANYATNLASIKTTIQQLLTAAANADTVGQTAIAGQLRTLALFYAVSAKSALAVWDAAVQTLLVQFQAAEKEVALTLKNQVTAEVNAAFAAAEAEAEALLADALADCHNQGAGN